MTAPTEERNSIYIPGFDGLRAIAVLAVFGLHIGLPGFSMGWVGVNLFFVLSGLLITRLLLMARGSERYFYNFYLNRSLRIFPIYFLSLAFLYIIGKFLSVPTYDWPWYAFYLQNWRLPFSLHGFPLMQHTWTLAVEEQFYLIWPIAVAICSVRNLMKIAIGVILFAPLFRFLMVLNGSTEWLVFSPTPCFLDNIAWGALAALVISDARRYLRPMLILISTACIPLVALIVRDGLITSWTPVYTLTVHGGVILPSLVGSSCLAVIIVVLNLPSLAHWLEFYPLRYIGRISYGMYLYHVPMISFIDRAILYLIPDTPWVVVASAQLTATIAVAMVSYNLVERRFLALKASSLRGRFERG